MGVLLLRDPAEAQLGFSIPTLREGFVHVGGAADLEALDPSGESRGLRMGSCSLSGFCRHLLVLVRPGRSAELEGQAHGGVKDAAVRRRRRQEDGQGAISLAAEDRRKDWDTETKQRLLLVSSFFSPFF